MKFFQNTLNILAALCFVAAFIIFMMGMINLAFSGWFRFVWG